MIALKPIRLVACLTICQLLLLSCSGGGVPQSQHFLLATPRLEVSSAQSRGDSASAYLAPISATLPAYLRNRGIVLIDGDREVHVANYHFWAEPFDDGIVRLLRDQLPEARLTNFKGLELEIHYFHGNSDGGVLIDVSWALVESCGENLSSRFIETTRQLSDGYSSLVEAHVRLLTLLAEAIAEETRSNSSCF